MYYFDLFGLTESFIVEPSVLKTRYYELSRKYHPDFYTQAGAEAQAVILEKASEVNKAFKTLQNSESTIQYILQQKGLLLQDEKYALPAGFLMEVMELNEALLEAKMADDAVAMNTIKTNIQVLLNKIYEPVKQIVEGYKKDSTTTEELLQVKQYYFQKKYLNRILAAM